MGHEQGVTRDFVLLKQKVQGRKWWEKRLVRWAGIRRQRACMSCLRA